MANDKHAELPLRHDLRPGDIGRLTALHGTAYASEYGFDYRFEAYVAESLGELGRLFGSPAARLWLAEQGGALVGSVGILPREGDEAQLRWFLVAETARRRGLGRRLLDESVAFSRRAGYRSIYLWTVDVLADAARLYTALGFRLTEEAEEQELWGRRLREQRYDLSL